MSGSEKKLQEEIERLRDELFQAGVEWEAMESALCHHCSRVVAQAVEEAREESKR